MYRKIKNIFFLISFFIFIFLVTKHYFSEENIVFTNKSRSSYLLTLNNDKNDLPILKNDTNNIIEYSEDVEIFKKNKKSYIFWDLIKK